MEIWHYHRDTGALIGAGTADLNPVEPGQWLIPAHATATPPPTPAADEEVVWQDGAWVVRALPPPPAPEPAPEPPPPAPIRAIRTFAFRQRLSVATRRAITLSASQQLDDGDATLQTWLDDLASTGTTLLDDPDLIAGVGALHAAGLITAAERTALLADGTPEEV